MPLLVEEAGDPHGKTRLKAQGSRLILSVGGGKVAHTVQIKYILLFLSTYNKNNNISTTTKHISYFL
jgi:hypothetical protein